MALCEIWAAGASVLASQRVALLLRDIQLRLSQWGYWGPPIHNMGPCSRPGEDPNAWKQFGLSWTRAIEPRYRPPGQRGILGEGLRGGSRLSRPFGARRFSSARGLAR
jgi:hypothetical protein